MFDVDKISLAIKEFSALLRRANWKVIILCFSTAATFWFFNALNKEYTTQINYPIKLALNRDSLVVLRDPPDEVPINVTGGGWQLLKSTISVKVEPVIIKPENPVQTQFLTSNNLLPIFSNQLKDLNINYVAIDTIVFKIDPYANRNLRIKLDSASIQLKDNYYITSDILMEPDSVNFHGPASLVNQLPDVFMVSLSDKNINNKYDEELSLDLFSPSLIKKIPEVIHIAFEVEEFIEQTATLNVEMVNFPYDSSIYIQNSNIEATFSIQKSARNEMNKEDFLIIADLNDMHVADSTITIEVMDLPDYINDIVFLKNSVNVIYAE